MNYVKFTETLWNVSPGDPCSATKQNSLNEQAVVFVCHTGVPGLPSSICWQRTRDLVAF